MATAVIILDYNDGTTVDAIGLAESRTPSE
jgi:hypothetical protein